MNIIGLLPASGKASRMNGLPKFALPCDTNNTSLLEKHIEQMSFYVDKIVISTTSRWYELVKSFNLFKSEIVIIEPSTMNDAIIKMSDQYKSKKYVIGMPDTYFKGENPYIRLSESIKNNTVSVACWPMHNKLIGKVGQLELVNNSITDIQEKVLDCDYKHLWGAMAFDNIIIKELDRFNAHVGIDLQNMIYEKTNNVYAFEVNGSYFDAGTLEGYKNLLDNVI